MRRFIAEINNGAEAFNVSARSVAAAKHAARQLAASPNKERLLTEDKDARLDNPRLYFESEFIAV